MTSSTPSPLAGLQSQLQQLDALIADGTLTGAAAKAAREALARRVAQAAVAGEEPALAAPGSASGPAVGDLGVTGTTAAAVAATAPSRSPAAEVAPGVAAARPSARTVAGVVGFVLAFGAAGYAWRGDRAGWSVAPGQSAAAQTAASRLEQIDALLARLAEHLKAQPDDVEGWSMLARSYAAQGRSADALPAFKRVMELRPDDAQAMADYADALAVSNNRSLDGEPEKLIQQAIKIDPKNVKALSLAGTIAFNRGDFATAVAHWDHAVQAADPGSTFAQQIQGALDEARKRAGLPPSTGSAARGAASAAGGVAVAKSDPAARPAPAAAGKLGEVSGRVTLAAAAKADAGPEATVFIFARAPTGSRMPLAILRKKVSDLPLEFKLDDSMAMSPAARLSSVQQVVVGARVSKSGNAMPQPGDWQALSSPVPVGTQGLNLEIREAVGTPAK
jgi:cytochrome c-type biogenesis protein CcmH